MLCLKKNADGAGGTRQNKIHNLNSQGRGRRTNNAVGLGKLFHLTGEYKGLIFKGRLEPITRCDDRKSKAADAAG